jgi:hypothetical protein
MKQLTPVRLEDTRSDFLLGSLPSLSNAQAAGPYRPIEPAIGTPDHAALIGAIRREFPEVYDPKTPPSKAD